MERLIVGIHAPINAGVRHNKVAGNSLASGASDSPDPDTAPSSLVGAGFCREDQSQGGAPAPAAAQCREVKGSVGRSRGAGLRVGVDEATGPLVVRGDPSRSS